MKRIYGILTALLTFASCTEQAHELSGYGSISLALSSEVEADIAVKSDDDKSLYNVYINGVAGKEDFSENLVYGEMPSTYSLPYGVYSVEAENCTLQQAHEGDGRARYSGITSGIKVKDMNLVPVSVDCRMVNSKVTVSFDEEFLSEFDEESVSVSLAVDSRMITVDPSDCQGRIIYFNVDPEGSEFVYEIRGSVDDVDMLYTGTLTLLPAKHAKINVKSNHNGILGPDTSVQDELEIGTEQLEGVIDLGNGTPVTGGSINIPVIYVDYAVNPAVDVDCIIDVIK